VALACAGLSTPATPATPTRLCHHSSRLLPTSLPHHSSPPLRCAQITLEELNVISKLPHYCPVCAYHEWNLDGLVELIWEYLDLLRIYTKPKARPAAAPLAQMHPYGTLRCQDPLLTYTKPKVPARPPPPSPPPAGPLAAPRRAPARAPARERMQAGVLTSVACSVRPALAAATLDSWTCARAPKTLRAEVSVHCAGQAPGLQRPGHPATALQHCGGLLQSHPQGCAHRTRPITVCPPHHSGLERAPLQLLPMRIDIVSVMVICFSEV